MASRHCETLYCQLTEPPPSPSSEYDTYSTAYDRTMKRIDCMVREHIEKHDSEDPFYIVNVSTIKDQYRKFKRFLPRVTPFYAVKCNPSPIMIKTLWEMGARFDCASKQEMNLVHKVLGDEVVGHTLEERAHFFEENIIFANPCKQRSHIIHAKNIGVKRIVVDSVIELGKMHQFYPEAELVVRIKVDDSQSLCKFSSKFGADIDHDVPKILEEARRLNLNVVGVSFHVGSGCGSEYSHVHAVEDTRRVFDMAEKYGYKFSLVNLGGGWNGNDFEAPTFQAVADRIRRPLDQLFPEKDVTVIAEPGRFFAQASHTLVANVFAKKEKIVEGEKTQILYINDGIYQSFNCLIFDHQTPNINTLVPNSRKLKTEVFGPTCDSADHIASNVELPELEVGSWIYIAFFGAYTVSASSQFNGFNTSSFYFVHEEDENSLVEARLCDDN